MNVDEGRHQSRPRKSDDSRARNRISRRCNLLNTSTLVHQQSATCVECAIREEQVRLEQSVHTSTWVSLANSRFLDFVRLGGLRSE